MTIPESISVHLWQLHQVDLDARNRKILQTTPDDAVFFMPSPPCGTDHFTDTVGVFFYYFLVSSVLRRRGS